MNKAFTGVVLENWYEEEIESNISFSLAVPVER